MFVNTSKNKTMNTSQEIEKHNKAIEILDRIESIERQIKFNKEHIVATKGYFPDLEAKYIRQIEKGKERIKLLIENLPKFESYV